MRTRSLLFLFAALLALAPATSALATIVIVNQTGTSFVPNDLTVTAGDTVRWVWSALVHTVTNGTDLLDPGLGSMFDSPLSSAARNFRFQFNTPGVIPYLCRVHEAFGMTGVIRVRAVTGVDPGAPPRETTLLQNAPNPFNPSTRIEFIVASGAGPTPVMLRVYALDGRLVRTLKQESLAPGQYGVTWDGRTDAGQDAASGVYAYRLDVGKQSISREMSLVR